MWRRLKRMVSEFDFVHLSAVIAARRLGGGADRRSLTGLCQETAAMLHVSARFATILVAFAPVFVQARTWQHAQMLLLGALLVPGQRTVCSIGLRQERHFVTWHRVLNRAVWDSRLAARLLLKLLVEAFVPTGPLLGIDDSIERRRGKPISAKGIYRDPVRSSRSFFVKTSGLRWLSLMLLSPIPW